MSFFFIVFVFVFPVYSLVLAIMAFFQFIGGKYIAKLPNSDYGVGFKISFIATFASLVLLILMSKIGLLNGMSIGDRVFLSIFLSIISLIYTAKVQLKCDSLRIAIKASILNVFVNTFFWLILNFVFWTTMITLKLA